LGYILKTNEIEFFVKDTGIGIPQDRQKAIFERFIQSDIVDKMAHQGAGLGLAISKSYVEMMGGKIRVESEPGNGSVFYFTLPYHEMVQSNKGLQSAEADNSGENLTEFQTPDLKILIAEDDEISDVLLSRIMHSYSKQTSSVHTGIEAVEYCRNHPDINLILMDVQMPGINGYEATRQIRQFNKDVIIIAQTAYGLLGDMEKAMQAGCNDYISKPIDSGLLKEIIYRYFSEQINAGS
jgi:CheY-like chemotaxis protein